MGSLGDEPVSKESHDLKPEVHKAEESATQVHEPEADVQDVDIQSTEQGHKSEAQGADAQEAPEAGAQEAKGQETEAQEAELRAEAQEAEELKAEAQEAKELKAEAQEAKEVKAEAQEAKGQETESQEAEELKVEAQEAEELKAEAQEAKGQETEAQEAKELKAEAQEAKGLETEAQEAKGQETEAQEAVVEQIVPVTGDRAAPNGRRKLPEVKRFSARRSVAVAAEDSKAAVESKSPSIARKQQRQSARMNMGIDDRDTVDYGAVTTEDLKPPPPVVVVKEAPKQQQQQLSVPERERLRLKGITRNRDIVCLERIRGKLVNITQGLELHTGVFSRVEQNKLVDLVRELQDKGRRQELKDRTYSEPRKWMRGKGRVTLQFGCCYNYAVDKNGNPPGILREDVVDPIPPLLRTTIKRLIRWHVLPPSCVPDSCIINMYEEGDCIPPHIDHHDFLRPFCTLSLLSECNIVFGANLEILGPGDFGGNLSLPLPVGSVLVLNGNGADVAKHAVPAVPTERISITFRKMDPSKVPVGFKIDTELQSLKPVSLPS